MRESEHSSRGWSRLREEALRQPVQKCRDIVTTLQSVQLNSVCQLNITSKNTDIVLFPNLLKVFNRSRNRVLADEFCVFVQNGFFFSFLIYSEI